MKTCSASLMLVLCLIASGCSKPQQSSVFEMRLVVEGAEAGTEEMTLTNEIGQAGQALPEVLHVQKVPAIDQTLVRSASVQKVSGFPYPYVEIDFTDQGRERFAQLTRESIEIGRASCRERV